MFFLFCFIFNQQSDDLMDLNGDRLNQPEETNNTWTYLSDILKKHVDNYNGFLADKISFIIFEYDLSQIDNCNHHHKKLYVISLYMKKITPFFGILSKKYDGNIFSSIFAKIVENFPHYKNIPLYAYCENSKLLFDCYEFTVGKSLSNRKMRIFPTWFFYIRTIEKNLNENEPLKALFQNNFKLRQIFYKLCAVALLPRHLILETINQLLTYVNGYACELLKSFFIENYAQKIFFLNENARCPFSFYGQNFQFSDQIEFFYNSMFRAISRKDDAIPNANNKCLILDYCYNYGIYTDFLEFSFSVNFPEDNHFVDVYNNFRNCNYQIWLNERDNLLKSLRNGLESHSIQPQMFLEEILARNVIQRMCEFNIK